MQRARRLASVAVVAALAVAGLSACRSAPSTAAYVGGGADISQDEVDAYYQDATAHFDNAADTKAQDGSTIKAPRLSRQEILGTLVGLDVLRSFGKANGITPQALTADQTDQVAASLSLSPGAKFAPLYAEYQGYLVAAGAKAPAQQVTEAEVRDIFDRWHTAGMPGNPTFEDWVGQLQQQDQQLLTARLALQQELKPVATKMDIVVNPRYPSSFSLLSVFDTQGRPVRLLDVPVGDPDEAVPVTDAG